MNKQEALRLLSKAPDGTTHIHSSGDYFKNEMICKVWEHDRWLPLNILSTVAMFKLDNAHSIEHLRKIASVTRDEALQWCVDNVSDWDIGSNQPPQGWKWCKAVSLSQDPMVLTDGEYEITKQNWLTASSLTREEALQWCVDNVSNWPDFRYEPRGWRWESCGPYKYALCHSVYDPIIESNWIDEGISHRANVTYEQALQWCVDNVSDWDIGSDQPPQGWKWKRLIHERVLVDIHEINEITEQDWLCAWAMNVPANVTPDQARRLLSEVPDYAESVDFEGTTYPLGQLCNIAGVPNFTRGSALRRGVDGWSTASGRQASDPVHQPKHYEVIEGLEAIEIIASSLTRDEWKGYCIGNILKYRLRAGKKDALQQDIDKANEYEMLFDKYKELNRK